MGLVIIVKSEMKFCWFIIVFQLFTDSAIHSHCLTLRWLLPSPWSYNITNWFFYYDFYFNFSFFSLWESSILCHTIYMQFNQPGLCQEERSLYALEFNIESEELRESGNLPPSKIRKACVKVRESSMKITARILECE